jgi:phospholipid-binding lipoprotein MlaA
MNSTVGLLGLFDPAQGIGIEPHSEDFGQTLAVWGVAEGPYIFVPLLGPTNLRDGLGNVVDNFLDPLSWATFEGDDEFTLARGVVGGVAMREELLDPIDDIRATSVDPYVRFRSLYSIMRDSEIRNGAPTTEGLLDFDAPPADAGLIAPDTGSNAPIDGAGLPAPPPSPPSPPPTPRVFNGVNPDDDRGAS